MSSAVTTRYTPDKYTGPVYSDFSYLHYIMLICIMCRDILFNHVPASNPQSRGNSLEPRDGHRTIPSNEVTPSFGEYLINKCT